MLKLLTASCIPGPYDPPSHQNLTPGVEIWWPARGRGLRRTGPKGGAAPLRSCRSGEKRALNSKKRPGCFRSCSTAWRARIPRSWRLRLNPDARCRERPLHQPPRVGLSATVGTVTPPPAPVLENTGAPRSPPPCPGPLGEPPPARPQTCGQPRVPLSAGCGAPAGGGRPGLLGPYPHLLPPGPALSAPGMTVGWGGRGFFPGEQPPENTAAVAPSQSRSRRQGSEGTETPWHGFPGPLGAQEPDPTGEWRADREAGRLEVQGVCRAPARRPNWRLEQTLWFRHYRGSEQDSRYQAQTLPAKERQSIPPGFSRAQPLRTYNLFTLEAWSEPGRFGDILLINKIIFVFPLSPALQVCDLYSMKELQVSCVCPLPEQSVVPMAPALVDLCR
ncbi:sterile alpha motif domain-containing protein 1-like [Bos indicus]|uniref:Sterile alpha motif domain-containing protein 1-like n=1 Tax=Bos indicus TaxID=9915 RepID=A0ABM4TDB6_BOSIN